MSAAAREAREANAASLSAAAERSTELAASLQSFDLDALFHAERFGGAGFL